MENKNLMVIPKFEDKSNMIIEGFDDGFNNYMRCEGMDVNRLESWNILESVLNTYLKLDNSDIKTKAFKKLFKIIKIPKGHAWNRNTLEVIKCRERTGDFLEYIEEKIKIEQPHWATYSKYIKYIKNSTKADTIPSMNTYKLRLSREVRRTANSKEKDWSYRINIFVIKFKLSSLSMFKDLGVDETFRKYLDETYNVINNCEGEDEYLTKLTRHYMDNPEITSEFVKDVREEQTAMIERKRSETLINK